MHENVVFGADFSHPMTRNLSEAKGGNQVRGKNVNNNMRAIKATLAMHEKAKHLTAVTGRPPPYHTYIPSFCQSPDWTNQLYAVSIL